MDQNTFIVLRDEARHLLSQGRLSEGLDAVEHLCTFASSWSGAQRVAQLRESYAMQLNYFSGGFPEPGRAEMRNSFLLSALEVVDALSLDNDLRHSDTAQAGVWRTLQAMPAVPALSVLGDASPSYMLVFETAWTSLAWSADDAALSAGFMERTDVGERLKCIFVSGVMLSVLACFDERKASFLVSQAAHESLPVRARALLGFVFCTFIHRWRIAMCPALSAQISLYTDRSASRGELLSLQLQLLLSLETKKIARSLRDEILPELMRKAGEMRANGAFSIDKFSGEMAEFGMNPDWDADKQMGDMGKKLRRIIDQQRKGADVFLNSFSMLKQKFPFFSRPANWFYPFDARHADLALTDERRSFVEKLSTAGTMCNSDKYSFAFVISEMPDEALHGVMQQFAAAIESVGEVDASEDAEHTDFDVALRVALQDVYRFFKLFRNRKGLPDVFDRKHAVLTANPFFSALLSSEETLTEIAGFAFGQEQFDIALGLFEQLSVEGEATAALWQKMGYCLQRSNRFDEAATAYERSLLLEEGASQWTLRQLALCLRLSENYDRALRYYRELLDHEPDSVAVLLRMGECLARLEQYGEAVDVLYKAHYLDETHVPVLRALAWCTLRSRRFADAGHLYERLLATERQPDDLLSAAHARWLDGDVPAAVQLYGEYAAAFSREAASASASSAEETRVSPLSVPDFFKADADFLLSCGLSETDLQLMRDAVLQRL